MCAETKAVGAKIGWRLAVAAAERLSELSWLAITNAVRYFADRQVSFHQHLSGPVHSHRCQVIAEGRVANLGKGTLQLAPGGRHARGEFIQRKIVPILEVNDRRDLLVEVGPQRNGCLSLHSGLNTSFAREWITSSCERVRRRSA